MKKVIIFITLLLLAALPKLVHSREIIKSFLSTIPGTPPFLQGKNPLAIGMASGAFVASALTPHLNDNGKGYKDNPKKVFHTTLTSFEKINKIL